MTVITMYRLVLLLNIRLKSESKIQSTVFYKTKAKVIKMAPDYEVNYSYFICFPKLNKV